MNWGREAEPATRPKNVFTATASLPKHNAPYYFKLLANVLFYIFSSKFQHQLKILTIIRFILRILDQYFVYYYFPLSAIGLVTFRLQFLRNGCKTLQWLLIFGCQSLLCYPQNTFEHDIFSTWMNLFGPVTSRRRYVFRAQPPSFASRQRRLLSDFSNLSKIFSSRLIE
jgi:hypothetical protein